MSVLFFLAFPCLALKLPEPTHEETFFKSHPDREALGRLLFWDKILSGNRNISCGTCHHPKFATADGLSLGVGQGGVGLGPERKPVGLARKRIPRNAPALFNLGAWEFTTLFWDGRVQVNPNFTSGYATPENDTFPEGLDHILAAQAMFPLTSEDEMAGNGVENEISTSPNRTIQWLRYTNRIKKIPEYVDLIFKAYPELTSPDEITILHLANAIGAYESAKFRSDNSPFDHYLKGDETALSQNAKAGMTLFYGKANCASCHSGPFQTDHTFHALGIPQLGPGKNNAGHHGRNDYGRSDINAMPASRFHFLTPSLRNVALTGPWGHSGAYATLEGIIRHHLDPIKSLHHYDYTQVILPFRMDLWASDFIIQWHSPSRYELSGFIEISPQTLSETEIDHLVSFLEALTDPSVKTLIDRIPAKVPSGLPVED